MNVPKLQGTQQVFPRMLRLCLLPGVGQHFCGPVGEEDSDLPHADSPSHRERASWDLIHWAWRVRQGRKHTVFFTSLSRQRIPFWISLSPLWRWVVTCYSVTKSYPTLWHHRLQHTRLPCPSLSPGVFSNSCLLSQWCDLTILGCQLLVAKTFCQHHLLRLEVCV